ncbi:hypothetical protein B484DRAFT_25968 [Ochromonadaceae sp. CCMP2298]|nr:hypothetical protein B484DRAFT_25968 [Ochromonadaceae sp. CCMP2298]
MMDEHRSRTGTTVGQDIGLSIKVTDYYFVQDGDYFDRHFFIVTVVAENIKFSVDRSYVDFVEFDRLLRKKFPETHFRPLPLEHAVLLKSVLQRYAPTDAKLGSGLFIKQMYQADPTSELFRIPEGQGGEVASKQDALSDYLCELLLKHEVVASEEIRHFLDEERRGMLGQRASQPLRRTPHRGVPDAGNGRTARGLPLLHKRLRHRLQLCEAAHEAAELVYARGVGGGVRGCQDADDGGAEGEEEVRAAAVRGAEGHSPIRGRAVRRDPRVPA